MTHRRHQVREIVHAGPIDQLLERYLDRFDASPNTLTLYRRGAALADVPG